MKNYHPPLSIIIPLLLVLVSFGLSANDDLVYKNTDKEHLELLMKILDARNVPYKHSDGVIRYNRGVKDEIEKAGKALASAASVQYVDPDLREYFHALLFVEGIEFIGLDRDGGSWTLWWAGTKDREMDILNQVVEYKIKRQMEEDLDCESGSSDNPGKPTLIKDVLNSPVPG